MLTIGQLAAHVGVTVRAIRHYHKRGLLAEPERDASGYRRYDAQAVVDLIRIKTLSDAGVPLAHVKELISAPPAEFTGAVAQIDEALKKKIRELAQHRRKIAALAEGGGERLFLPAEVVDLLDRLREIGVSERTVQVEREAWILMAAFSPEVIPGLVKEKTTALADPELRRLYLACDKALGWDPSDPRLAELAGELTAWNARHPPDGEQPLSDRAAVSMVAVSLLNSQVAASSPTWHRLSKLVQEGRAPHVRSLTAAPTAVSARRGLRPGG